MTKFSRAFRYLLLPGAILSAGAVYFHRQSSLPENAPEVPQAVTSPETAQSSLPQRTENSANPVRTDTKHLLQQMTVWKDSLDKSRALFSPELAAADLAVMECRSAVERHREQVRKQQELLTRFSALLIDEQGVILDGQTYVPQAKVREQMAHETARLTSIQQRLGQLLTRQEQAIVLQTSLLEFSDRVEAACLQLAQGITDLKTRLEHLERLSAQKPGPPPIDQMLQVEIQLADLQAEWRVWLRELPGTLTLKFQESSQLLH